MLIYPDPLMQVVSDVRKRGVRASVPGHQLSVDPPHPSRDQAVCTA